MKKKRIESILFGTLKLWTLFIAVGALVGALMMWIDPSGKMWQMDGILKMLQDKMPFADIFFKNFIPSSIVLLIVNGFTQAAAAFQLFKKSPKAARTCFACGLILMAWIVLEWGVFGFYGICNAYFIFGLLEAMTAIAAIIVQKIEC